MISILLVEDKPEIVRLIEDVLKMKDYNLVGTAFTGREAIEMFKEKKPDVVLMDILLPDTNGVDVTKEMLKIDPRVKIIAVTAVSKNGLREECLSAGCVSFITKPFKVKELIDAINSAVK